MPSEYQRWKGIMKCVPFDEKRLNKWTPPYICQPKFDGVRCRAIPLTTSLKSNEYLLLSSEENIIYSVPHINRELSLLSLQCELDGELYHHGMKFEDIVSITSRTVNLHEDYNLMQFHIFDVINNEQQIRRQLIIENLRNISMWLRVAPFWLCENLDDIMRVYEKLLESKYEGIIVRNVNAPYERKRSSWIMKFKAKKEDEYEIVGYEEEMSIEGNPKNSLGALRCKSGDGNIFSVGTGFSRDMRNDLWKDREALPGCVARVKYQHLTTGRQVPRFPVFVEVVNASL